MTWHVYIVGCEDGKLYAGIANDLKRRAKAHNSSNGDRFTKYRQPVKLGYSEGSPDKPQPLKREAEIKSFPRIKKLKLVDST